MTSNDIFETTKSSLALFWMGQVAHVIIIGTKVGVQMILGKDAAAIECFYLWLNWLIMLIAQIMMKI